MAKRKKMSQDKKILIVLLSILAVCFVAMGLLFYLYFYAGTGNSKYGDRLDGVKNHAISKTLESDIKTLYSNENTVKSVSVRNQGKIIYINMVFTGSVTTEAAESLAVKSLDKVGEDNLTFYEIQYILDYAGEEENNNFPILGSKSTSSLKVVWSK